MLNTVCSLFLDLSNFWFIWAWYYIISSCTFDVKQEGGGWFMSIFIKIECVLENSVTIGIFACLLDIDTMSTLCCISLLYHVVLIQTVPLTLCYLLHIFLQRLSTFPLGINIAITFQQSWKNVLNCLWKIVYLAIRLTQIP